MKRNSLAIAGQAISTMTAAGGVNDTYRIYLTTKRDDVDFNLAFIGEDFPTPYKGPFDKAYMNTLFDYGFEKGKAGYALGQGAARLRRIAQAAASAAQSVCVDGRRKLAEFAAMQHSPVHKPWIVTPLM